MRQTLVCIVALILSGFASTRATHAADATLESRPVKVEAKPKFIPNGAGQKPFDATRHTIPLSEIQRSVPKNAIPVLVRPQFVSVASVVKQLKDKDRVVGVFLNGEAKAYPISILNWHELVNDEVGNQPILVSW